MSIELSKHAYHRMQMRSGTLTKELICKYYDDGLMIPIGVDRSGEYHYLFYHNEVGLDSYFVIIVGSDNVAITLMTHVQHQGQSRFIIDNATLSKAKDLHFKPVKADKKKQEVCKKPKIPHMPIFANVPEHSDEPPSVLRLVLHFVCYISEKSETVRHTIKIPVESIGKHKLSDSKHYSAFINHKNASGAKLIHRNSRLVGIDALSRLENRTAVLYAFERAIPAWCTYLRGLK